MKINLLFFLLFCAAISYSQPVEVAEIYPGSDNFTEHDGWLYYTSGDTLFKTNGGLPQVVTSGLDNPGQLYSVPGSYLYFTNNRSGMFSYQWTWSELWITDGSNAGTSMLVSLDSVQIRKHLGGLLFFTAFSPAYGKELWKTTGTVASTELVKDISPGPGSAISFTSTATNGSYIFFTANDGIHGEELWRSDGTLVNTIMVANLNPFATSTGSVLSGDTLFSYFPPFHLTNVNGIIFFIAGEISVSGFDYIKLWKTDGSEGGTQLVKLVEAGDVYGLISFQNQLFFIASDDSHVINQLWKSDGTEAGTVLVKSPLSIDAYVSDMNIVNNMLVFTMATQGFPTDIWVSDGTTSGTFIFRTLNAYDFPYGPVLEVVNNTLFFYDHQVPGYFGSGDGITDHELWQTDLTPGGTFLVKTISTTDTSFAGSGNLTAVNGALYFTTKEINYSLPINERATTLWKYTIPSMMITSFTLVDATTDTDIRPLNSTDTIYTDQVINIRANISGMVESVVFRINSNFYRNENQPPYAIAGDASGNYNEWDPEKGLNIITAIPYSENNGEGEAGIPLNLNLMVLDPEDTLSTEFRFILVDADLDVDIDTLYNYQTIVLDPGDDITIRVEPRIGPKSVLFTLNGSPYRSENIAPYSLTGDNSGDFHAWSAPAGWHTIIATTYSRSTATGNVLESEIIRFEIVYGPSSSANLNQVVLTPNPAADNAKLLVNSNGSKEVFITITDVYGREYFSGNKTIYNNEIDLNYKTMNMTIGVYLMKLQIDNEVQIVKIKVN